MKDIARALLFTAIFATPFIPLLVTNSLFFPFITGKNFAFRILVEIMLASWAVLAFYDARYRPKFSWILASFTAFMVVMFAADFFGKHPFSSFWSNFERMEGFVTLAHAYLYFVVLGSTITTGKLWRRFWYTSLFAALIGVLYAFAQMAGTISIRQSDTRLDGPLGNSAYFAMYMLFHVFVAAYYLFEARTRGARIAFGIFAFLFLFVMVQTQTRGTALGFVVGSAAASLYVVLFGGKENLLVRKVFAGIFAAVIVLAGSIYVLRDTALITSNDGLNRIAHTSFSDLSTRLEIWTMAIEGVKERPVVGWGQNNFNYVFNKYYDPSLWGQESWFDRVHNIVIDWLIATGVVGAVLYFSVLGSALYYLAIVPLRNTQDETFPLYERAIFLGLLVSYTLHNFFVFDNVVTYLMYGAVLAYIHSRIAREIPQVAQSSFDHRVIENVVAPIVVVSFAIVFYFVNVPNILAARDIIAGFAPNATPDAMIDSFELALSRGSFGNQEIREQLTRRAQGFFTSNEVPEATKQRARELIEGELLKQIEEKPDDARVHVFISSFYRATNQVDKAIEQLSIARSLSPQKQQIIFEQGLAHMQKGDNAGAFALFKEAFDLDTTYPQARSFYAMAALYEKKFDLVKELVVTEDDKRALSQIELAIQAAYEGKQYDLLIELFGFKIAAQPADSQLRASLAVVLHESGDTPGAVEVLKKAGVDIPEFKEQADKFAAQLLAGKTPGQP